MTPGTTSAFSRIRLVDQGRTYWVQAAVGAAPDGGAAVGRMVAADILGRWFTTGVLGRQRQCDLYRALNSPDRDLSALSQVALEQWVVAQVLAGTLVMWRSSARRHGSSSQGSVAAAASASQGSAEAAPPPAVHPAPAAAAAAASPGPSAADEAAELGAIVAQAEGWQGKGLYPGVDAYKGEYIEAGTILVGGSPGQSEYYSTPDALSASGMSRSTFGKGLQIAPHPQFGYRPKATYYRVTKRCPSAAGMALANPHLGAGGLPQYYIPDYKTCLEPINTVDLLA